MDESFFCNIFDCDFGREDWFDEMINYEVLDIRWIRLLIIS